MFGSREKEISSPEGRKHRSSHDSGCSGHKGERSRRDRSRARPRQRVVEDEGGVVTAPPAVDLRALEGMMKENADLRKQVEAIAGQVEKLQKSNGLMMQRLEAVHSAVVALADKAVVSWSVWILRFVRFL